MIKQAMSTGDCVEPRPASTVSVVQGIVLICLSCLWECRVYGDCHAIALLTPLEKEADWKSSLKWTKPRSSRLECTFDKILADCPAQFDVHSATPDQIGWSKSSTVLVKSSLATQAVWLVGSCLRTKWVKVPAVDGLSLADCMVDIWSGLTG